MTWKDIIIRRTFRMTFRDHPEVVDGDELLAAAIVDLTTRVTPFVDENLRMGLSLNWDGAEKPWCVPFKPVEAYCTSFLRTEFALRSQSARSDGPITGPVSTKVKIIVIHYRFLISCFFQLSITFTWLTRLCGSGLRPTMGVVAEQMAGK